MSPSVVVIREPKVMCRPRFSLSAGDKVVLNQQHAIDVAYNRASQRGVRQVVRHCARFWLVQDIR